MQQSSTPGELRRDILDNSGVRQSPPAATTKGHTEMMDRKRLETLRGLLQSYENEAAYVMGEYGEIDLEDAVKAMAELCEIGMELLDAVSGEEMRLWRDLEEGETIQTGDRIALSLERGKTRWIYVVQPKLPTVQAGDIAQRPIPDQGGVP